MSVSRSRTIETIDYLFQGEVPLKPLPILALLIDRYTREKGRGPTFNELYQIVGSTMGRSKLAAYLHYLEQCFGWIRPSQIVQDGLAYRVYEIEPELA